MPQRHLCAAPDSRHGEVLPPEVALACAILRVAVTDARGTARYPGTPQRNEAIAFLLDRDAIRYWSDLLGCDTDAMHAALLRAAGLDGR